MNPQREVNNRAINIVREKIDFYISPQTLDRYWSTLVKTWMHSKDGSWCIKRWQQSVSPPPEMPPLPGLPNEPGTVRPPELPPMTFRAAAAARDPGRRRVCRFFSAFFNLENDSNLRSLVSKPGHKPYKSWYFGSL